MRIAVSFTGGKDSSLVTTGFQLLASGRQSELPPSLADRLLVGISDGQDVEIAILVTFVPAGQSEFKAHPLPVVASLAGCLQVQHVVKQIAGPDYLAAYVTAIKELASEHQIEALATGDILDVCSNFMGRASQGAAMPLLRPLWGIPRMELLQHLWALGMHPVVTCVNVNKFKLPPETSAAEAKAQPVILDSSAAIADAKAANGASAHCHGEANGAPGQPSGDSHFSCMPRAPLPKGSADGVHIDPVADLLGHAITPELHERVVLPASLAYGVDECGEHGEFHTMCVDGPTHKSRLEVVASKVHEQGSEFAYLLPSSILVHPKTV